MPGPSIPEPAVAIGDDPRQYAMLLSEVYDATMAGGRGPAKPRQVIAESWNRLLDSGIDPEHHDPPEVDRSGLDVLRESSGLMAVLADISRGLESVIADGSNILVVADARGRVLWRSGTPRVLSKADRLGFVEGADWGEPAVGTNAIGTALVSRRAVQVFSAEHFLRSHHTWTCAGAPIRDPRTGHVIGAVDVSGPAATVHPTTVALVDLVARLSESRLREVHERTLNRLRAVAAPMLARIGAPALAVDPDGWVAAVDRLPPHNRILLPHNAESGRVFIPALGACELEPLSGGWLVRPLEETADGAGADAAERTSQVTLDLRNQSAPMLAMMGPSGSWRRDISPRHAEILLVLAVHRGGRSATELAADLYGDGSRAVTVRAEMSRLRRQLVGLIAAQPYRFADGVVVDLHTPADGRGLLPASTAPAVRVIRDQRGQV
ncbi:GAF domain-containing protein [Mycolicibacterium diernhoferi]|uniref:Diguanylate cyclase n=1 Tax=Mycolicibacterium diernhoferi TaxID=1801 RepID=A0A1T3W174_9MYCO|nr:GAF domain-containing protein [Mycolicibacterium diernhoferi]OPE48105.1 diguanylate cyclase [Mycolicibacterium diernhoferi]